MVAYAPFILFIYFILFYFFFFFLLLLLFKVLNLCNQVLGHECRKYVRNCPEAVTL